MDFQASVFKRKRVTFLGLTVMVIGVVLTYISVHFYTKANAHWKDYSEEAVELYSIHDRLAQALGYGGFIHSFKNLVLRKDIQRYGPVVESNIAVIKETLSALEQFGYYGSDTISDIRKTIGEYETGYQTTIAMIAEGKSSEEIDSSVLVDDTAALSALRHFNVVIRQRLKDEEIELAKQFSLAFNIQIFSAITFISLIGVYIATVFKASKKEYELTQGALKSAEAKSNFLANMSHEIRTPMNGVMGTLQLLERDVPKGKNLILVKKAIFSTRSLVRIINDVLDFSKIEAGELSLEAIDFSFREIVESVNSDMLPKATSKKITLSVSTSGLSSDYWLGDPVRIRQILLNLTSNAVKFTKEGSVSLTISEQHNDTRNGVLVTVADTGIGMSEEALESLFERFKQADNSTTRKFGGTGLGMSITQNLVELMEGDIRVSSEPDKGTRFDVFLPLSKSTNSGREVEAVVNVSTPDLMGKTILVADDNDINRVIVVNMLQETKAKLMTASNGVEAINIFKEAAPDLILMDIQMPEMDGVEACLRIKEQDDKVPIIALTANVMKEDIENYRNAGFSGHLGKPLEMNRLFGVLTKYLSSQD